MGRKGKNWLLNDSEWEWKGMCQSNEWNASSEHHIDFTDSTLWEIYTKLKKWMLTGWIAVKKIEDDEEKIVRDAWGNRGGYLNLWWIKLCNPKQCI